MATGIYSDSSKPNLRPLFYAVLTGAAYYFGAKLGFALTPGEFPISTLWSPNAILFAALLLAPMQFWWVLLVAVLPAHILVQLESGVPLLRSLGWFLTNTTEGLLGAILIRKYCKSSSCFDSLLDVGRFLICGVVVAPFVTSFFDAGVVASTGWQSDYWELWGTRLISNMLANLIIVPAVVTVGLSGRDWLRRISWNRYIEALLLGIFTVLISSFIFQPAVAYAIPVLVLFPLLWAVLRFGQGGVSISLLTITLITLWNIVHEPLTEATMQQRVLTLQIFLTVMSITMISLAAVLNERRQVTEALLKSEDRMSMAAEWTQLGFWSYDFVTGETWISDHLHKMLNFGDHPVSCTFLNELIHPEDRQRAAQKFEESLTKKQDFEAEYRLLLPENKVCWVNNRARTIFDPTGKPIYTSGVVFDSTERKMAAIEAETQRQELMHLTRVSILGQLSGALAHELNQPLAAILSNAQAAQRFLKQNGPQHEEFGEILRDIAEEDKRAGAVIQRLRALLKKEETKYQSLNLNEVVSDVLRLTHSDLLTQNVNVTTKLEKALPMITGDFVQLQQVMLNLILNACEAMTVNPSSDRALTLITEMNENNQVSFAIEDSGPGIEADLMDRIFEPFVTTKQQGLGLGLSISRSILSAHNGSLLARNNDDQGATFYMVLPAEKS
ncbi:MASE1 domain-containing protein [bacterium]|nr:MASE1 domain-containing protein [bacterium]